jgi:hypothetical protein
MYSLAHHSPRALGDYSALVVDDKRRVLHAVWTQPGERGARIFHAVRELP